MTYKLSENTFPIAHKLINNNTKGQLHQYRRLTNPLCYWLTKTAPCIASLAVSWP